MRLRIEADIVIRALLADLVRCVKGADKQGQGETSGNCDLGAQLQAAIMAYIWADQGITGLD